MSQRYYPRPPASETRASIHTLNTLSGETTVEGQQPRPRPATNLFSDSSQGFGSDSAQASQRPWMPYQHIPIPPVHEGVETPPTPAHAAANGGLGVETRILLGLDFGTTYTGLAVFNQAAEVNFSLGSVTAFTHWDGKDEGSPKVPSVISYSPSAAGKRQWGSEIDNDASWASHWVKLDLLKQTPLQELSVLKRSLHNLKDLQRHTSNDHRGYKTPHHLTKSPEEIVQDFLYFIAEHYYRTVKAESQHLLTSLPIDMVLTHPANWPYEAINKTYRAAMGAFDYFKFPTMRNIFLCPEPEACAVFTVQDMVANGQEKLVPGACFVVCDAGGGTVDLVTYRMLRVDPLELQKIGDTTSALCGATYIDRAFLSWIGPVMRDRMGQPLFTRLDNRFVLGPKAITIMSRFEIFKRQFTGVELNTMTLPSSVVVDESFTQVSGGLLPITAADMRGFFEHSVSTTIDLISDQVTAAQIVHRTKVSHVFLSGGMAQSDYLHKEVSTWVSQQPGSMVLSRPREVWSAVVQGAVLCGAGIGVKNAVHVRSCPRHFGVIGSEVLTSWKHPYVNVDIGADEVHGTNMAMNQIKWLIQKGDVLIPGQPIEGSCVIECSIRRHNLYDGTTLWVTICATDSDEPPKQKLDSDTNEMTGRSIRVDIVPRAAFKPRTRTGTRGEDFLVAVLEVKMTADFNGDMFAEILCEGQRLDWYRTAL